MATGLITLVWHDYKDWDQFTYILNASNGPVFVYAAAAAQIFGGVAIQFRRTAKTGALVLGVVYLVFALLYVPRIVAGPRIYDRWGNFFEQFSLVTGAAIIHGRLSSAWGRILFGISVVSFTLEQAIYLDATTNLVPKWLPPGQLFWAIATTVPFALASVALLTNRMALLATRLLPTSSAAVHKAFFQQNQCFNTEAPRPSAITRSGDLLLQCLHPQNTPPTGSNP